MALLSDFIVFSQSRIWKVEGGHEKMNIFTVETLSKNTFSHKLWHKVFPASRPSMKTLDNIQKTLSYNIFYQRKKNLCDINIHFSCENK